MNRLFSVRLWLIWIPVLAAGAYAQRLPVKPNDRLYLGFLDDQREEMLNWQAGVAQHRVVRPAFERTSAGWVQVEPSSLPSRMKWTIVFDGRSLGQVESQAQSAVGLTPFQQILTAATAVPTVGSPSFQFGGLNADPTKTRRPLIVVSKPNFQDPDGWKRTTLSAEIVALVRTAFRRDFPHVDRCKDEEILQRNWKFPDSALTFPAAYASNKQAYLVEADLNAGDCGYVDDPNNPLSGPWFFVTSDGTVRHIGSFMSLLDAGDYDNDGQSEVIFFMSQPEDTDGFVLYDASFRTRVTFTWTYH